MANRHWPSFVNDSDFSTTAVLRTQVSCSYQQRAGCADTLHRRSWSMRLVSWLHSRVSRDVECYLATRKMVWRISVSTSIGLPSCWARRRLSRLSQRCLGKWDVDMFVLLRRGRVLVL